ncbi:MAG: hypothetical protein ACI9J3_000034 [Parvicellaceae bacterium]|jgi:hypothetical protein
MLKLDPKITLQGIIDGLTTKLNSYLSAERPSYKTTKAMKNLINDLYLVFDNMDLLLLFSIWTIVEKRIFEIEDLDPEVSVFVIELRRSNKNDNKAIINLNNQSDEK